MNSKETTKKESTNLKSKCLVEKTLSILKKSRNENQQFTSIETTNTINDLIRHIRTGCSRCPKDHAYLMIGVYYFELFKSRLNKFKNLIIDKETTIKDEPKDKEKDKNWDSIKIKNCDSFSDLINLDSQKRIVEYLFKTIDIWKKLLDVKERLKSELIEQLEIFDILKNCFFIFTFYGATKYTKQTCTIYLELALLHGQTVKNHLFFAYYCQIRFCLNNGLDSKAKNYLKTCNSLIKNLPKNRLKFLSTEIYLIKIVECELRLVLNEEIEQAVIDLKELIDNDYFKTITVISGYIKCLIFYLMTKFSAKVFSNQELYHYFNDSFVFTKSIFTKWYPFLSDHSTNESNHKQININSPIWLEFAVAKFTFEFSLTYYYHSINCSVVDIHFYFNILVTRLARLYCSLLW